MNKRLIAKYNQEDTILVISTYPKRGKVYATGEGGVASFCKNTITPLTKQGQKTVILANKINGKTEIHQEGSVLVVRCWQRGSFSLFGDMIKKVMRFKKVENILIHFEFSLYDGLGKTLFFPLFLLALKILGKKPILIFHQVIFNLDELSGHLGWKRKSLSSRIFSQGIMIFYWLMGLLAEKIVVLEKEFAKRLTQLGISPEKIKTIPHGVDTNPKPISQTKAKKLLGYKKKDKIILVFGFLTWYKGSDLILKKFHQFVKHNSQTHLQLVLAGGESPSQKEKSHYRQYINNLYHLVKKCPRAEITGFIKEEKIPLYFSASDWVILPYRTFMSSSGPLSLAITFEKPFLLSSAYSRIFKTKDFKKELNLLGLSFKDLIWEDFAHLPSFYQRKKIKQLARQAKNKRSFECLAQSYLKILKEPSLATVTAPQPAVVD